MAESEITTKMEETPTQNNPNTQQPRNPFSQFLKIDLKSFISELNQKIKPNSEVKEESKTSDVSDRDGNGKPSIVRYPNKGALVTAPIEAEAEESGTRTHDPFIVWQVYAVGGFMMLKWLWARWNERKERAKKNDEATEEDESPNDED